MLRHEPLPISCEGGGDGHDPPRYRHFAAIEGGQHLRGYEGDHGQGTAGALVNEEMGNGAVRVLRCIRELTVTYHFLGVNISLLTRSKQRTHTERGRGREGWSELSEGGENGRCEGM